MVGRRINGLRDLTPEQDLEAVKRYYESHLLTQAMEPENRSHWFETHMAHAKKHGTNISEQMVISQQMTDAIDGTDYADDLRAYLLQ